jgi:hypothetical protein
MAKYSKKSQDKVEKSMHEMKRGKLRSGSGKKVKSRKQAIAIGLSEARQEGAKAPKKASSKKSAAKKASKKSTTKKSSAKKSAAKKGAAKKAGSRKRSTRKSTSKNK